MEGRRSTRVLAKLNLLLAMGGVSHNALTAVVNRDGALILSPVSYPVDTELEVRNMNTGESAAARVVWYGGPDQGGLFKLGIELTDNLPGFWKVEYPEAPAPKA